MPKQSVVAWNWPIDFSASTDGSRHGQSNMAMALRQGLVRTPNDFGFQGGGAIHRELLDELAPSSFVVVTAFEPCIG